MLVLKRSVTADSCPSCFLYLEDFQYLYPHIGRAHGSIQEFGV